MTLVSEHPLPYLDIRPSCGRRPRPVRTRSTLAMASWPRMPAFAEACQQAGIVFIGPPAAAIATMGDKVQARAGAMAAGVPVVPGTDGPVDIDGARAFGEQQGYPIALKAAAGGGGRGFRVALVGGRSRRCLQRRQRRGAALLQQPDRLRREATSTTRATSRSRSWPTRHGNVVGLGERDCSIQRRHQKLVEESPSPAIDAEMRAAMNADGRSAGPFGRLRQRRDAGVPRPGRPVLLPGDEHPHPGRASRHRAGDRHRPRPRAAPDRRRRAALVQRAARSRGATRSSAGSTPRTRRSDFKPTPGPLQRYVPPAASACASIPASTRAARSTRASIR